ncbi:hypothetical protein BJ742DRAFT_859176 [Cladochytrium replicatum]|nr:hypothetical protein BJ742DRAFT_859176 [Cladochytrium replicatum]
MDASPWSRRPRWWPSLTSSALLITITSLLLSQVAVPVAGKLGIGVTLPTTEWNDSRTMQLTLDWHLKTYILNRTDAPLHPLLGDLVLVLRDVGSPTSGKIQVGIVEEQLEDEDDPIIVGFIGAGFSRLTELLSYMVSYDHYPVCDGSASSEVLSSRQEFPNFYRTVAGDNAQALAIFQFILRQGWGAFSVVYADDIYGKGIYAELSSLALHNDIVLQKGVGYTPMVTSFDDAFIDLRAVDASVIVFAGFGADFKRLLNAAIDLEAKLGRLMFGKGYAWITSDGITLENFGLWSQKEVDAMYGVINVSPYDYRNESALYRNWIDSWKTAMRGNKEIQALGGVDGGPPSVTMFFVDCLESMVRGFNNIFNAALPTTTNFTQGERDRILQSNVPGNVTSAFSFDLDMYTGPVRINASTGSRSNPLYQFRSFLNGSRSWSYFGTYSFATSSFSTIHDEDILYSGGVSKKPADSFTGSFDPVDLTQNATLRYIFFFLSGFGQLLSILSGILIFAYRNNTVIKAASPMFLYIILLGCVAGLCFPVMLVAVRHGNEKCLAEIWILPGAMGIIFGTILSKIYRVLRIFQTSINSKRPAYVSNLSVLVWTALVVGLELLISLLWTLIDAPKLSIRTIAEQRQPVCASSSQTAQQNFTIALSALNAMFLLVGAYLSVATRKVPTQFRESVSLAINCYHFMLVGTFILPLIYLVPMTAEASAVTKAVAVYSVVFVTLGLTFGHKFYVIVKLRYREGLKDGKDGVIVRYFMRRHMLMAKAGERNEQTEAGESAFANATKKGPCFVRHQNGFLIPFWKERYLVAYANSGVLMIVNNTDAFDVGRSTRVFFFNTQGWTVDKRMDRDSDFFAIVLQRPFTFAPEQFERVTIRFELALEMEDWYAVIKELEANVSGGGSAIGNAGGADNRYQYVSQTVRDNGQLQAAKEMFGLNNLSKNNLGEVTMRGNNAATSKGANLKRQSSEKSSSNLIANQAPFGAVSKNEEKAPFSPAYFGTPKAPSSRKSNPALNKSRSTTPTTTASNAGTTAIASSDVSTATTPPRPRAGSEGDANRYSPRNWNAGTDTDRLYLSSRPWHPASADPMPRATPFHPSMWNNQPTALHNPMHHNNPSYDDLYAPGAVSIPLTRIRPNHHESPNEEDSIFSSINESPISGSQPWNMRYNSSSNLASAGAFSGPSQYYAPPLPQHNNNYNNNNNNNIQRSQPRPAPLTPLSELPPSTYALGPTTPVRSNVRSTTPGTVGSVTPSPNTGSTLTNSISAAAAAAAMAGAGASAQTSIPYPAQGSGTNASGATRPIVKNSALRLSAVVQDDLDLGLPESPSRTSP